MIAFILAGGKGTRLEEITKNTLPKPLVKIAGKPILQYQIEFLKKNDVKDVIISVDYKSEMMEDYFKDGSDFGLSITYSKDPIPLGTAGSFKYSEKMFKNERDILVLYGDLIFDIDLLRMILFHQNHDGIGTLLVHPNDHPYDSDLFDLDKTNRITRCITKPHSGNNPNLVNAGIYILRTEILNYIEPQKYLDFGKDIFPSLILKGKSLYAYRSSEYVKDIGTPKRYYEVEKDILNGKIYRRNLKNKQKAVFLDRDGVINKEVDLLYKPEQLELIEDVPNAIKRLNDSDYLSIVVTNQSVVARGLCTEEDIKIIHNKLETLLGEKNAFLDRIYYCPYHPDRGYPGENKAYKMDSECRKPKIGMLLEAEKDFNISNVDSFMIGDATVDIQTGMNYGAQTILVKTGYKGLDKKYAVTPNYEFENLSEAVQFILEDYPAYFKFCNDIFEKHNSKLKMILIGGNSRSGKSVLASVLKHVFELHNKKTKILPIDNWLIPLSERKDDMNVYQRYNKDKLIKDLEDIINGRTVRLNPYDPLTRESKKEEMEIQVSKGEALIIEGVITLGIEELRDLSELKIFVKIDEETRKERFYKFYRYKNLTDKEIEKLYLQRYNEEVQEINKTEKFADCIFDRGEISL